MPTITANTLITRVQTLMQDTTGVRWPNAELLNYLNDGQREICALRPDANSVLAAIPLAAGTKQTIPSTGIMLIDVIRNMGSGSTPGQAIRKVPREMLDSSVPNWHIVTAAAVTLHYTFDPKAPRNFYVYPPANGSTQVEALYSAAPADVAAVGNTITLDDIYANALMDYMMFRAYSKDTEFAGNADRATAYRQSFENSLGLKAQGDASNVKNPNIKG